MGYLLDTNALLWFAYDSVDLGKQAVRAIQRGKALHFSPLSFVELRIKAAKGLIKLPSDLYRLLVENNFLEVPLVTSHAAEMDRFGSLITHDPFDRMLIAQAASEGLTFVTGDSHLISLDFPWIMDARV